MLRELAELVRDKAKADRGYHDARHSLYEKSGRPSRGTLDGEQFELDLKRLHGAELDAAVSAGLALEMWIKQQTERDLDAMVELAKWAEENG